MQKETNINVVQTATRLITLDQAPSIYMESDFSWQYVQHSKIVFGNATDFDKLSFLLQFQKLTSWSERQKIKKFVW